MVFIIDVQFCVGDHLELFPKVVSFGRCTKNVKSYTIITDNPYCNSHKALITNSWLTKNLHGHFINDGKYSIDAVKLEIIKNVNVREFIYTKGEQKVAFLKKLLKINHIYDLKDYKCPSIQLLLSQSRYNTSSKNYSINIVKCLIHWSFNNEHNLSL
jgi:hypothetical protein